MKEKTNSDKLGILQDVIGRVKGANSDYSFELDQDGEPVIKKTDKGDAWVKMFICPEKQPSNIEVNSGEYCSGIGSLCPSGKPQGHVTLELHEKNGASLIASTEKDESNFINVGADKIILEVGDTKITIRKKAEKKQEEQEESAAKTSRTKKTASSKASDSEIVLEAGRMKLELNKDSIELSGPDGPLCSMGRPYYMITEKAMLMLKEEYKKSNIENLQGLVNRKYFDKNKFIRALNKKDISEDKHEKILENAHQRCFLYGPWRVDGSLTVEGAIIA